MSAPASTPPLAAKTPAAKPILPNIPAFDALRGYAILGVLFIHCMLPFTAKMPPGVVRAATWGGHGVQLFYVVSACTLFWSLHSRTAVDRRPLSAFFLRRFFRIAPAFWVAITVSLLVDGLRPRYNAPAGLSHFDVISTYLFAHGWYPTSINSLIGGGWSIAVEMPFYLIVPFCFRRIRTLSHALRFVLGAYLLTLIAEPIGRHLLLHRFPPDQAYLVDQFFQLWLPAQLPVFGFGFVLFFLVKDRLTRRGMPVSEIPPTLRTKPDYLLLWALLIVGAWSLNADSVIALPPLEAMGLLLLLFSWMLIWWPIRLLVNPLIAQLGKISYGMYLFHFLILGAMPHWVAGAGTKSRVWVQYLRLLGATFLCAVIIATLSYYLIERPMIALGKNLLQKLRWGPPPRAPAASLLPPSATAPL